MPTLNGIHTATPTARFLAYLTAVRQNAKQGTVGAAPQTQTGAEPQAVPGTGDRVEISLSAGLTVETANGILAGSMLQQLDRVIQESGINTTAAQARTGSVDLSPEATATRIAGFATGFMDAYRSNHATQSPEGQVQGFMALVRGAVGAGFKQAKDFLQGLHALSGTIAQNIQKTFELTKQALDNFHQAQLDSIQGAGNSEAAGSIEGAATQSEVG